MADVRPCGALTQLLRAGPSTRRKTLFEGRSISSVCLPTPEEFRRPEQNDHSRSRRAMSSRSPLGAENNVAELVVDPEHRQIRCGLNRAGGSPIPAARPSRGKRDL